MFVFFGILRSTKKKTRHGIQFYETKRLFGVMGLFKERSSKMT